MPGIYGFDHMVVRVEDFNVGMGDMGMLPGLELRMVGENEAMGLQMAFYDLPNGGFLELVAPTRPDSVLRPALDKSGPGMNLIAFQCDDLAATVDMMKANGVRIIETDPRHIMVHPKSTHGVLLQLVEKDPNAPRATKAGQVPDTSGVVGIVSYKCTVVFVKDAAKAIESYEALGLKLHFNFKNEAAGIVQAGFFLKGGGLIELIGPIDPADRENGFVKLMETRPEGFKHLSLDGSPGAVEALTEAGVRTRTTDPQHCDLHKDTITGCREQLFQLNPVGMGTGDEVGFAMAPKI